MARRARRKQSGVIGTLVLELSALAGILGIAQPTLRNNLWSVVNSRPTQNAPFNSPGYPTPAASPQSTAQFPFSYSPASGSQSAPTFTQQQALQQSIQQPMPQHQNTVINEAYTPAQPQTYFQPTYTAQAILPPNPTKRPLWQGSMYNPMGGYQ